MTTQVNTDRHTFRFRCSTKSWLTDEIAAIEALATERLRAGVSLHSVQTGALALVKLALDKISGELVELPVQPISRPACPPPLEPPPCTTSEGRYG